VRYALLSGHPRKQLNFTLDSLHATESALEKLRKIARQFLAKGACTESEFSSYKHPSGINDWSIFGSSYDALRDDLNVPMALGWLFDAANQFDFSDKDKPYLYQFEVAALSRLMFALGFDLFAPTTKAAVPAAIAALAEKRWGAKQAKDFAAADALRKELAAAGWSMLDSKTDYKLEPLRKS
jgi:cysteinyl-tRNA synthetase